MAETERDLKRAHEIIVVSHFHQKTLTDKVLSLMEELYFIRVEHANLPVDLNEMRARVKQMKEHVGKSFFKRVVVSAEDIRG